MKPSDRAPTRIVATPSQDPSLDELTALEPDWTERAHAQFLAAAAAVERWLREHPEDAARFVDDPLSLVTELSDAGVLAEPIDDLLGVLRARPRASTRPPGHAVRFSTEGPLGAVGYDGPEQTGGR